MIYLEILELNFLGLNKNTKRNIKVRSIIDFSCESGRDPSVSKGIIDINEEYLINDPEQKDNKNIEMLAQ